MRESLRVTARCACSTSTASGSHQVSDLAISTKRVYIPQPSRCHCALVAFAAAHMIWRIYPSLEEWAKLCDVAPHLFSATDAAALRLLRRTDVAHFIHMMAQFATVLLFYMRKANATTAINHAKHTAMRDGITAALTRLRNTGKNFDIRRAIVENDTVALGYVLDANVYSDLDDAVEDDGDDAAFMDDGNGDEAGLDSDDDGALLDALDDAADADALHVSTINGMPSAAHHITCEHT
jgi:hypothetical protein